MISGRNILNIYPQLLNTIQGNSIEAAPRGAKVSEHIGPILWTIDKPWEWALMIPGRRLNPFFALAEVVWMWSGKGGLEFITYYNSSMKQFADEGVPYFNGAYGRRIRHAGYDERPFREIPYLVTPGQEVSIVDVDQLDFAIKKIKADPETRQAVISLWDPVKDNFIKSHDHPCNNMVYLSQRRGFLNITVVIRSNDLIWGVPYNMIQFVHLQALVAGSLDLKMGVFSVFCNNLHYYHDLYKDTLDTVLGWRDNLQWNKIDTEIVSDTIYQGFDDSTMLWDLDRFDGFVRNVWDSTEKTLRHGFTSNAIGAYYSAQWMKFEQLMDFNHVPQYWRIVFTVMFMFHVRKAKITELYLSLLVKLPPNVKWLITDFDTKEEKL